MGVLEPLTVLGLGRSPYDDIVMGEGEGSPMAEQIHYDERGRAVSMESRRFTRSIIRAHNEVMHVVGVAEFGSGPSPAELRQESEYLSYEITKGCHVTQLGMRAVEGGWWLMGGLRSRLLLYPEYAGTNTVQLLWGTGLDKPFQQLFLAGLPTYALYTFARTHWVLRTTFGRWSYSEVRQRHPWVPFIWSYLIYHAHLFIQLQRVGLVEPYSLPHPGFFVPFTSRSLIQFPPLPGEFNAASVVTWFGKLAVNMAPIVLYGVGLFAKNFIYIELWKRIFTILPRPTDQWPRQGAAQQAAEVESEGEEEPAVILEPEDDTEGEPTGLETELNEQDAGSEAEDADIVGDHESQGNASSAVHDDRTEEDDDMGYMAGPHISFDLDTTETPDQAPGAWSAELRPAATAAGAQEAPKVHLNTLLTTQPHTMATEVLTSFFAHFGMAPIDTWMVRDLARVYLRSQNLPTPPTIPSFSPLYPWSGFGVANFAVLGLVFLGVENDIWSLLVMYGRHLRYTLSEWKQLPENKSTGWTSGVEAVRGRIFLPRFPTF